MRRRSLLLLFTLCFVPLSSVAQTGVITGRVVSEDGSGLPGMTVTLLPVAADRRARTGGSHHQTGTDLDGNFKFTGLAPRVYSVSASPAKSYVPGPVPVGERQDGGYYRVGDNVTITMIKGGVITGRVTNATGEPLIGARVNAVMTRGAEGNMARRAAARPRFTDDRGFYRIYGLPPGTYVVFTRNAFPPPYDRDTPTYHPSSTRETAAEVTVASGGEVAGVDIRYRGDRGYVVSGSVSDGSESYSSYTWRFITLTNTVNGAVRSDAYLRGEGNAKFAIYGVADGEYEITARWVLDANDEVFASTSRLVVVKGADVGGIELKLLPMGSITGKFALEATPGVCESKRKWSMEEALLALRFEAKLGEANHARSQTIVNGLSEKGEFTVYNLTANRYFLEPRLPNENWYVKAITASASTSTPGRAARSALQADIARNGITLKSGEKVAGVTVTIADGASGMSGKVVPATEGARPPARLRIHLVPAEAGDANDVLRYAEAFSRNDGAFSLSNIAPGKYWLFARAAPDEGMSDSSPAPIAWDANERAKLHHDAMAAKNEIELQPCRRIKDYVLRFNR
jgi:Carboxypeptidase regulatory-like domain